MEPGRVLSDRYALTELLGRGGMAEVHRATDRTLGRDVAIKILPENRATDDAFVRRFEREARAAASLNDPHIVAVHDTGSDGGSHYIVMELVEGPTLEDVIAERGPLPADEVIDITRQVCDGLAAAHEAGLVHRDIKPGNIMFDRSGTVKVTDFGIALATAGATMTQTGSVYGSAPYLSPEQARGEDVDERADLYALGCVVYSMLVGEAPFTGSEPLSIVYQHLHGEIEPPSTRRDGVPAGLDAVVARMLAKDREDRYPSAAEARADLDRVTRGEPPVAADLAATRRMDASEDRTLLMPAGVAAAGAAGAAGAAHAADGDPDDGGTGPADAVDGGAGRDWRTTGFVLVAGVVLIALLLALRVFSPGQDPVASSPEPTPNTSPSPASSPTPAPPPSLEEAVFALFDVVNEGVRQGEVTEKAADELGKLGNEALQSFREGDVEEALEKLDEGRRKVEELTAKREIQPDRAELILAAIDQVEGAVRRQAPPSDEGGGEDDKDDKEEGDGRGPEGGGPPGKDEGRGEGDD
ncbi:MAG: protein kinase [Actinobacteria bacterium]|nr:protein kinase [Actinomycetota bacterium]